MVNDFLFELGCEELPSAAVWSLAQDFAGQVQSSLDKAGLTYGKVKSFATPRRMALLVLDLQTKQNSQILTRRGPALVAAYDAEGKPTPALLGFAKSCQVEIETLRRMQTDKGDWMVCDLSDPGRLTKVLLPDLIKQSFAALPMSKPMRWGHGEQEFIRPVHWAVMLYGNEVIEQEFFGIKTGRKSRGHRFHHPQEITILSPQSYETQMQAAFVIADFDCRRQNIIDQIKALAAPYDAQVVMPEELIHEVTSIVEWPQALMAHFAEDFLAIPPEALIASMQLHQKTFALRNQQGELLPHFIAVANLVSTHPLQVVQGNEKVMRARLSDAEFFFNQDKKQTLSQGFPATEKVVFQVRLGSLQDKALRLEKLMTYLSPLLSLSKTQAQRAAFLSKCDLLTGMVAEFPELQGVMGYYYALHDGEELAVAKALKEQYLPRFAADDLPDSLLGKALSLADRLDTLVGIFAINQKPSGVKDPFKLRRHALAIVRLLLAIPVPLELSALIHETFMNYGDRLPLENKKQLLKELKAFVFERLLSYYQNLGIGADEVQAVRATQDECLYDLDQRLQALQSFKNLPEALSLSTACKRVNNLLSHANLASPESSLEVQEAWIEEGAEKALYQAVSQITQSVEPLYAQADYASVLKKLASLKEPVDVFFDKVMVMVEEESIKKNRLALLRRLQKLLQGVADISLLQIGS